MFKAQLQRYRRYVGHIIRWSGFGLPKIQYVQTVGLIEICTIGNRCLP
jgi:hypothetical protein